MLLLPIKRKWFQMILTGEKREEYREIKPYWTKRILRELGYPEEHWEGIKECLIETSTGRSFLVHFRNGYGNNVPEFIAECHLSIGKGKEEWGAKQNVEYFVFHIERITWSATRCII